MSRKKTGLYLLFAALVTMALLVTSCGPAETAEPSEPEATEEPAATEAETEPTESETSGEAIKIAFVGPLTGADGVDGQGAANAAQLAVEQINAAGGVCEGRPLELEAHDTKADPKEGVNVASSVCGDEDVYAAVADYNSSVALAEAPVFNECGLSQVNYYAAAPDIPKKGGEYTFRVYPPGQNMSLYLADWMVNQQGYTKIAAVYENTDYGIGLYEAFVEAAEDLGAEIVASEAVLKEQTDLSAVISKFNSAGAEAVCGLLQYQVGAYWMMQSEDVGLEAPLYGSDGLYAPEIINLAGDAVEGVRTVAAYLPDSQDPKVREFVEAHEERFGTGPNNPGGYAYDAVNLVAMALDGSGCSGRDGVQEWLANNVENIEGVTGGISFDEYGERSFAPNMYVPIEIRDGEWVEVELE